MSTELPQAPLPQAPQSPIQPAQMPQQAKGLFAKFGRTLKKIWKRVPKHIGLPAGIAMLTFVFLIAVVAVVWSVFLNDPVHVPWRHWMTTTRMLIIATLVLVIPAIVYRTLKLWLDGDASPYSDIEFAWKAGYQALADNGMSIESTPVFLILGSTDLEREQSIIEATGQAFRVRGVPEGPAPLHWYANPDGIYVFCSDIGCSSVIASRLEKQIRSEQAREHSLAGDSLRATDDYQDGIDTHRNPNVDSVSTTARSRADTEVRPVVLTARETTRQLERLRYLCHLLRRNRRPFCPVNGMVCLTPFSVLSFSPPGLGEFAKAHRNDLAELQGNLQLRCPTSVLVVGMEQESGFRELVRRFGRDEAASGAFGKAFDIHSTATGEQLSIFSDHVVGVFEDSVYSLFRDETALTRPGNTHLFSLLCQVRYELRDRLTELLVRGFSMGANPSASVDSATFFSGCYFGATGNRQDRQAFVQGVFRKLLEEQESVQWKRQALQTNQRLNLLGIFGIAVSVLLIATLGGLIAYKLIEK